MKKFVICLLMTFLLVMGISFFKYKTEATECWWGVLYPNLSYIAFEDNNNVKVSALDTQFIYMPDTTVKTKFFIIEWFKNVFNLGL